MTRLSFDALRRANLARMPTFRNARGEILDPEGEGAHWCLGQWTCALAGEVGELANIIKKIERGDFTLDDVRADVAKELADVVIYLDLLAHRAGVDLGEATIAKFNEVSRRVGSTVRLVEPDHD